MLLALSAETEQVILARQAARGAGFRCPSCRGDVLLKKGRLRIPHFAHRPGMDCPDSAGETERHRECKQAIYDALCDYTPMAYQVAMEKRYPSHGVRADVYANIRGIPVAIELQRSTLSVDDLDRRTRAYTALGIAVLWIVAHIQPPSATADRYAPKAWEKWLHALYGNQVYYWLEGSLVVPVRFDPYYLETAERSWYDEYGEERWAGGISYRSKRFVTPHLGAPVDVLTDFVRAYTQERWALRHMVQMPPASLYCFDTRTIMREQS